MRYRLEPGSGARATDFVGELIARNDDFLIVDTRSERVKLIRADVLAAKDVPPPASRPGPAHQRVSPDDLEQVMARGWVAIDRAGLGDWVLRSARGFTARANSALVVGDPSLPVDSAISFVERWYAERDAPALFQLPGREGFTAEEHPVGAELLARGYAVAGGRPDWARVLVMTGLSAQVAPLTTESVPVTADAELSPEWLMAYGRSRSVVPGATEAVLTGSEGQLFLSVRDESTRQIVGIARVAIHPGWAGVFGLWVTPERRRTGLASTIVSAAAMVARENAMPAIYLQVSADNTEGRRVLEGSRLRRAPRVHLPGALDRLSRTAYALVPLRGGPQASSDRSGSGDGDGAPRARVDAPEAFASRRAGRDEVRQGVHVVVDHEDLRGVCAQSVVLDGPRRLVVHDVGHVGVVDDGGWEGVVVTEQDERPGLLACGVAASGVLTPPLLAPARRRIGLAQPRAVLARPRQRCQDLERPHRQEPVGHRREGPSGDPVGLHVVRVPVSTVLVVRDDDVGSDVGDDVHDEGGRLVRIRRREGVLPGRGRRSDHARVTVERETPVVGAEHVHRRPDPAQSARELAVAVRTQGVVGCTFERRESRGDDLALLTQGAGQHVHVVAARHVVSHGDAARQRLVVGVRVDEEQP